MIKFLVVVALAAFANANPILRLDGKIVGGKYINITAAPYQVSLFSRGSFYCGGSIISKDYVLTAAHCSDGPANSYSFRAGSTFKSQDGSKHSVLEVIVHEEYGSSYDGIPQNDIALMKVDPPFELDESRAAVPLFKQDKILIPGLVGLISGWGATRQGGPTSAHLQAVQVPLISKESCQKQYAFMGKIPKGEICAAYPEGGKDSCQGDSGGPLVVEGSLAGIVSWGYGCALPNMPGVYTEVGYYRDWIKKNSGV
ncbi:trypsin-2-like [Belonocnema kinseyi]|uniref:trypsin-2-like n=1 Tax=Belonocnema kinseyi TaxID=2817044 RepID=UPI00143D03BE|nr:trypsin-2-like [Belonocnema kinseyi]